LIYRALITGISGQDGWWMASRLLDQGNQVLGLSQEPDTALKRLPEPLPPGFTLARLDVSAPDVPDCIAEHIERFKPDLIFNFAARATGAGMFEAPTDMSRLNGTFVLDILEAIRNSGRSEEIRFVQASSSEMFGSAETMPQDEYTPLRPKSPYAAAKAYAHHLIGVYRGAWGLHTSSAILFNHESTRRSTDFVTRKIARGAVRIKLGLEQDLKLGTLDAMRDWGHAEEYVEAMYLMALAPRADDYVIATGRQFNLRDVCEFAFARVGLQWQDHVRVDTTAARVIQSVGLMGNPAKIERQLGWRARRGISEIIAEMVDHEMNLHCKLFDTPKENIQTKQE
jgi:GDPmannose 4,6-dehydratase